MKINLFWSAAVKRAVRTAAQTALALLGTASVGLLDADWANVASGSAMAAALSIINSIATGLPEAGPAEVAIVPAVKDDEPLRMS